MTWETVMQALILTAGATGASWFLGLERGGGVTAKSVARRVMQQPPPRGHAAHYGYESVRCDCGWRWVGGFFTVQGRYRKELGSHYAQVATTAPQAQRQPVRYATGGEVQRILAGSRNLGDPQNYCGRGMCVLGAGHSGSCTT